MAEQGKARNGFIEKFPGFTKPSRQRSRIQKLIEELDGRIARHYAALDVATSAYERQQAMDGLASAQGLLAAISTPRRTFPMDD